MSAMGANTEEDLWHFVALPKKKFSYCGKPEKTGQTTQQFYHCHMDFKAGEAIVDTGG